MYNTKGKERISICIPKRLLDKIEEISKKEGVTKTKYICRILQKVHGELDVKDDIDAVRIISEKPDNWRSLPETFQTNEVFKALSLLNMEAAASIMGLVPVGWWNCLSKDAIIDQAARNSRILHDLPSKYRRAALKLIRETAQKAWNERDNNVKREKKTTDRTKDKKQKIQSPKRIRRKSVSDHPELNLFDGNK